MTPASSAPPVSIVTGAGSGIGRAIALRLAGLGHRLTLVGRTEETLEATAAAIADECADASDVLVLPLDVSDREQAMSAVDQTVERWGRLDALVNNAAALEFAPIEEVREDRLFAVFAINVFGPSYLLARAWPTFVRQGNGCVVNISSMATVDPFPGLGVYAASKSALESLTRSIVVEGGPRGISAYAVAPGAVETEMLREVVSEDDLPPDKTLDPDDVARVVEECVVGLRAGDNGGVIRVPSP